MKKLPLIATTLASSILLASTAQAGNQDYGYSQVPQPFATLGSMASGDLRFMREEEKLARDVYLTLDEYWGDQTPVFASIAMSEEIHANTVDYILDRYGIADPVTNDTVGVFTNKGLQELYNLLITKGKASLNNALYVAGLMAEKDMKDISVAMDATDEQGIILAYANLLDGSKSQLRTLARTIEDQGLTYNAQHLDSEEVEAILGGQK